MHSLAPCPPTSQAHATTLNSSAAAAHFSPGHQVVWLATPTIATRPQLEHGRHRESHTQQDNTSHRVMCCWVIYIVLKCIRTMLSSYVHSTSSSCQQLRASHSMQHAASRHQHLATAAAAGCTARCCCCCAQWSYTPVIFSILWFKCCRIFWCCPASSWYLCYASNRWSNKQLVGR